MRQFRRSASRSHASWASAVSEPLIRLFISVLAPTRIENSSPRRISLSSPPPPGTFAVSSWTQGSMRGLMVLRLYYGMDWTCEIAAAIDAGRLAHRRKRREFRSVVGGAEGAADILAPSRHIRFQRKK